MKNKKLLIPLFTIMIVLGALAVLQNKKHKYQTVKYIHTDSIYIDSLDQFIKMSTYKTQDSTFIDEYQKFQIGDTVLWH